MLSNAFSAEFGWTAGPAVSIVTKSGTNVLHGEGLFLRHVSVAWQAKTFSTRGSAHRPWRLASRPTTLTAINPADIPDALEPVIGLDRRGRSFKDKDLPSSPRLTTRGRTERVPPRNTLPAFLLPADGNLAYTGNYRQELFNGRVDHKITPNQTLMVRMNVDRFYDTNPNDAVAGTSAPSVARRYRDAQ